MEIWTKRYHKRLHLLLDADAYELAKSYAEKYRNKAWSELNYLQKAKFAGLSSYYKDEATEWFDKLLEAIKNKINKNK